MGDALADGISDHEARRDEFRTTPLWGVRFRRFYLHDGRATALEPTTSTLSAATDRSSLPGGYAASTPCGGEPSHASLAAARPLSSGGRSRAGRAPRRRPAGDRARLALPHGGRRRQRGS